MIDERPDPAMERVAEALRPLPAVDESAKARVLVAVAAERVRARERRTRVRRLWRLAAGSAAAAVLVVAGVWMRRGTGEAPPPVVATAPAAAASAPASLASDAGDAADAASVAVQLVLRAPGARRVAVVGDFTGWDDARVAMERDAVSGLWSATVRVRPGRHVYAFIADDTVWMRDPRAPVATDPDFGRPGSLLLVGKP